MVGLLSLLVVVDSVVDGKTSNSSLMQSQALSSQPGGGFEERAWDRVD